MNLPATGAQHSRCYEGNQEIYEADNEAKQGKCCQNRGLKVPDCSERDIMELQEVCIDWKVYFVAR